MQLSQQSALDRLLDRSAETYTLGLTEQHQLPAKIIKQNKSQTRHYICTVSLEASQHALVQQGMSGRPGYKQTSISA
jgi:hypothetical protein